MHLAALPRRSLEHSSDRGFETGVGVGDHQAHSVEASIPEGAEELGPEDFVFGIPHLKSEDFPVAICRRRRWRQRQLETRCGDRLWL